jgi:hypothetical protein
MDTLTRIKFAASLLDRWLRRFDPDAPDNGLYLFRGLSALPVKFTSARA